MFGPMTIKDQSFCVGAGAVREPPQRVIGTLANVPAL